jgi:hypothetical protein
VVLYSFEKSAYQWLIVLDMFPRNVKPVSIGKNSLHFAGYSLFDYANLYDIFYFCESQMEWQKVDIMFWHGGLNIILSII